MTNRREFLARTGRVSGALVLGAATSAVSQANSFGAGPIGAVPKFALLVIDQDQSASRSYAAQVAAASFMRGVAPPTIANVTAGDVTDLWLKQLAPLWREQRAAITGLTGSETLFCLEQLAWPMGLRVVRHREWVASAELPGVEWAKNSALASLQFDLGKAAKPAGFSLAGLPPKLPVNAFLLHSWIIAPV